MLEGQKCRTAKGHDAKPDSPAGGERGGGNGDRYKKQKGERIFEAAREIEQDTELQHIIEQQQAGMGFLQPDAFAPADAEENVEPGAQRHRRKAEAERQREAKHEMYAENGTGLADNR